MIDIDIYCPGKTKVDFLRQGVDEFCGRLKPWARMNLHYTKNFGGEDKKAKEKEGEAMLGRIKKPAHLIALDPGGGLLTSEKLADSLQQWQDQGKRCLAFLIGGHLGLSGAVLNACQTVISLSPMTFTHEMVRLILLEQIYRAYAIIHKTGYHK